MDPESQTYELATVVLLDVIPQIQGTILNIPQVLESLLSNLLVM